MEPKDADFPIENRHQSQEIGLIRAMELGRLLAIALVKLKSEQFVDFFPVFLLCLLRKPLDFQRKLQEYYR